MKAVGHSTWQGSWKQGSGTVFSGTDTLSQTPYSYSSRFEGTPGASPEELFAVAQAGCFNQALANNFGMIGLEARSIETSVQIELGIGEKGRPIISSPHLKVAAAVSGITQKQFDQCADRARTNCTLARLLKQELTMEAVLLS